jgi:branched-chain amino acid transport system substrate-binding protein
VIKIGHVSPRTGPIAPFGEADPYILDQIQKLLQKGIVNGGRTYPVQIISKDSQSSTSRASEVAAELILRDKVDLLVAASTPDTTNPVADQAEVNDTVRHHRLPVAALFLRPQRRSRQGLHLDLSFLLGP